MLVEADLLGDHRLALGDGLRADAAADVEDDVARVLGSLGEVHRAARPRYLLLVGLEIEVEMGERVVLDVARLLAQLLELRQRGRRLRALVDEIVADMVQRPLQLRVGERVPRVLLEVLGGDLHRTLCYQAQSSAVPRRRTKLAVLAVGREIVAAALRRSWPASPVDRSPAARCRRRTRGS